MQLDLYKIDFEAEREARQNLAGEKEALVQQIRLLKINGTDEEVGEIGAPSLQTEQDYTVVGSYCCPKCNFKYPTVESLNNHLDVCLTQHMFP